VEKGERYLDEELKEARRRVEADKHAKALYQCWQTGDFWILRR